MRIAFLGDGGLNHVGRWVSYFSGRDHEVLLLSFEDVTGCAFPAVRLTKRLPTKLFGYLSALGAVKKLLADFQPQLVNALYVGGYGFIGALCRRRPFVVSALGSDLLVDYPSSPIHRAQIRYAIRHADLVTTDADVLSDIASDIGAPREKILKAYFGIDAAVYHTPVDENGKENSSAPTVVSTRKLHPIYNIDVLIDAAPEIIEAVGARFIVVGEGPEREGLERLAARRGVADRIEFAGRMTTEGIVASLQSAAAYVSTSRSDSTSVSLLEAMACGAPPVATDIPANGEWIEDGVNGLLFPPGDRHALARAVIRMIEDRDLARSARARNVRLVQERGMWETNMERVERAFRELLDEGP